MAQIDRQRIRVGLSGLLSGCQGGPGQKFALGADRLFGEHGGHRRGGRFHLFPPGGRLSRRHQRRAERDSGRVRNVFLRQDESLPPRILRDGRREVLPAPLGERL